MASSSERLQPEAPAAFIRAVETLRSAQFRAEVQLEEPPAPKRLATYTFALSADVIVDDEHDPDPDPVATGRLVLLHEPGGHEAWHGEFRLVTYIRASLEREMGADPLLLAVAWTWLTDALEARSAPYTAASGTVTRVDSEGFGGMAGEPASCEVEIRASWTPVAAGAASGPGPTGPASVTSGSTGSHLDLEPHALAWGDGLITAAGLLPLPAGVVAMPSVRSKQRRR
ncbi:DUF3000 domain-containing protein [Phytoactinopolyspora halotolerans]|uniref:DUF3000 domain-containing protein n=1 Tax=Phytoactinopolyspora halotolerans TaxID=1981512 RepID=UPI001C205424|nr:DUF3000 domain-containing protein [Phytoactinopolyspora halotolerans]